jgi:hypothetical protein
MKAFILSIGSILFSLTLMIAILASPSLFTLTETGRALTLSGPIEVLGGFIREIGSDEFFTVYF